MSQTVLSKLSFLVVDDEAFSRFVIVRILRACGVWKILEAADGQQALDKLAEDGPVDGIIADITMPVMDGLQLLEAVRGGRANTAANVPFIVISGHNELTLVAQAKKLQATTFVIKPITHGKLLERLERTFSGETAQPCAPNAPMPPRPAPAPPPAMAEPAMAEPVVPEPVVPEPVVAESAMAEPAMAEPAMATMTAPPTAETPPPVATSLPEPEPVPAPPPVSAIPMLDFDAEQPPTGPDPKEDAFTLATLPEGVKGAAVKVAEEAFAPMAFKADPKCGPARPPEAKDSVFGSLLPEIAAEPEHGDEAFSAPAIRRGGQAPAGKHYLVNEVPLSATLTRDVIDSQGKARLAAGTVVTIAVRDQLKALHAEDSSVKSVWAAT